MFNPFLKISLKPNTNEPQYISKLEINKNLTGIILADFFQTSLQLGWYQICFNNQGALNINGNTVTDSKDNKGDIIIQIKEVLPAPFSTEYKNLSASPFKKNCLKIDNNINGIYVGTTTIVLGSNLKEDFIKNEFDENFTFTMNFEKAHLYIKQDILSFITKNIVILILWSSLILLIQGVWKFLFPKNLKTR